VQGCSGHATKFRQRQELFTDAGRLIFALILRTVKPNPQADASKKEQVEHMFDAISGRYDLLNRLLSFGIDISWRKKVKKAIAEASAEQVLDVATGTADMAIELSSLPKVKHITGVDISAGMLSFGQQKIDRRLLSEKITLKQADSEQLPFPDAHFDACTVCFGVRNFEHLSRGIAEMARVLKPGGILLVLEFSRPRNPVFKALYWFYFGKILPGLGRLISGSNNAYRYLPESVKVFPDGNDFTKIMEEAGIRNAKARPLTFGICTLYSGTR
jgi:demethylmenaquinone methyltransferase/2-methoxy-6-polyprenyl-1,4-benzoquinol methylase